MPIEEEEEPDINGELAETLELAGGNLMLALRETIKANIYLEQRLLELEGPVSRQPLLEIMNK